MVWGTVELWKAGLYRYLVDIVECIKLIYNLAGDRDRWQKIIRSAYDVIDNETVRGMIIYANN